MNPSDPQLTGAMINTGIPGTKLDADTRRVLEIIQPSGVILFRRNVESVDQLRALIDALHQLPSRPLVSIDHEGGKVVRVGPPFTDFPPARLIGDKKTAASVGRAIGRELASVGIDIDYAPVLDVDSNPANPIIGERAFSASPSEAAELALAFADAMWAAGVVPCGKHFPGHGDTDRDSHLELPVVHKSRAQLEEVELSPFRAAVAHGIPLLMTAHVLYPALDPNHPATLSAPILQGILREELGFQGVIVSDDLEMRALGDGTSLPDAAVASLNAGCDWLLICNDFANTQRTFDRLNEALAEGEIDHALLRASAARIDALRGATPDPVDLPCHEHMALSRQIASSSTS